MPIGIEAALNPPQAHQPSIDCAPPVALRSTARGTEVDGRAPYCVASLVYTCVTRQGVVLMDLRRNKYSGLDARSARIAAELVQGLVSDPVSLIETPPEPFDMVEGERIAQMLLSEGLITRGPDPRPSLRSRTVSTWGNLIAIGDEIEYDVPIRMHHIVNFVLACAAAKFDLRHRALDGVASKVRARRTASGDPQVAFDPIRAGELVSVFRRLRPFLFTAHGHCLFHALALVTFLNRYGLFPAWVIGVKTDPWGAHSWVQEEDFILDTNPEKVCEFTPILAV
jgi:hypothetical protein